jgi:hypothetical protein
MIEYQRNQLMAQQAMIQNQLNQMNMQYQSPQNPLQTQYFAKEVNGFEETKRIVPNPSEIYIFIDGTSGKIYLKQMNSENGRSEYISYSMDKVERAKDPIEQINERLIRIEEKIGGRYEPVSANADGAESGGRDKRNAQEPVGADEGAESAGIQPGTADDKRKK